jgi:uncharacterized membrane protein
MSEHHSEDHAHHGHSHGHAHGHGHESKSWKQEVLQILISLIILVSAPLVIGFISRDNIQTIRSFNPAAREQASIYLRGTITEQEETPIDVEFFGEESENFRQYDYTIELNSEYDSQRELVIPYQFDIRTPAIQFEVGDQVIITRQETFDGDFNYFILDHYRLPQIGIIALIFFVVVVALTGLRGISAILGLGFSIIIIVGYLIPSILTQGNILFTTFVTGLSILGVSIYLAHGFSKRSSVALLGAIGTICLSTIFAVIAVQFSKLTGLSSEDAFQLQFSGIQNDFNFTGLLLAGIVIGTLGVLDDICTSQAATVQEISKANPNFTTKELFTRGMSVGQEHIISLVNTIALAYVSVALPLLLLFAIYDNNPLWVTLNREVISEELIRTIVGSMSLLLAVPITSILAARYLRVKSETVNKA